MHQGIERIEAFSVLGVVIRVTQGSETSELFSGIWEEFEHHGQWIESVSTGKQYYGVNFPTEAEHVSDYLFALSEIHRVLRHGGHFLVGLPYATLTQYHLVNPYHLHNFNEYSFDFFDSDKLKGSANETSSIQFKKVFHRFHYIGRFNRMPERLRLWCRRHLLNVVRKIDFGLLAVKRSQPKLVIDSRTRNELDEEFLFCARSRLHYEDGRGPERANMSYAGSDDAWAGGDHGLELGGAFRAGERQPCRGSMG